MNRANTSIIGEQSTANQLSHQKWTYWTFLTEGKKAVLALAETLLIATPQLTSFWKVFWNVKLAQYSFMNFYFNHLL